MLEKELSAKSSEDIATESWKLRRAQQNETETKSESVRLKIIFSIYKFYILKIADKWKSIVEQAKKKSSVSDETKPLKVKDYEYDFVNPCPVEMQQVRSFLHVTIRSD